MKAAGDNPELDGKRGVSYGDGSAASETAHTLSECLLPFVIHRLSILRFETLDKGFAVDGACTGRPGCAWLPCLRASPNRADRAGFELRRRVPAA
jgi:hypothetical protein